jgi:hypothetical protein
MSGEIIKRPRETHEAAIERWRRAVEARNASPVEIIRAYRPAQPVIQEAPIAHQLLRFCALFDLAWIANYPRQLNGDYVYNGSFWLEKRHEPHYRLEGAYTLPRGFKVGSEQCPCGAHTPLGKLGCVWCPRCTSRVCFGRTTPSGYFQCRESCGNHGQLQEYSEREFALKLRLGR